MFLIGTIVALLVLQPKVALAGCEDYMRTRKLDIRFGGSPSYHGKQVVVRLRSGKVIAGVVEEVEEGAKSNNEDADYTAYRYMIDGRVVDSWEITSMSEVISDQTSDHIDYDAPLQGGW